MYTLSTYTHNARFALKYSVLFRFTKCPLFRGNLKNLKIFIYIFLLYGCLNNAKGIITSGNLQFDFNSTNTGLVVTGGYGPTINIPASLLSYPVVAIGDNAFNGNSIIDTLTIPTSVTSIGNYAFYGCSRLASITLPTNLNSIGDYAFQGTAIKILIIPPNVNKIGLNPVANCSALSTITVTNGSKYFVSLNGVALCDYALTKLIAYCESPSLGTTPLPNTITNIGDYAFYGAKFATITIPNTVTSIGSYAFYNSNITHLIIPNSVTSLGDLAFSNDNPSWYIQIVFLGNAPTFGNNVFYYTQSANIYYLNNSSGWSSPTFKGVASTVITQPLAPLGLSAVGLLNSIKVTFLPPANSSSASITGYVATATSTRTGTSTVVKGTGSPILIPNLIDAYTSDAPTYYISLYATTAIGLSDPIVGIVANLSNPVPAEITPTIVNQPLSQNVVTGTTVTLSINALGGGLSYQWYKGTNAIQGAINSSYNINLVQPIDAATYYVVVSNNVGSVTSNIANVNISNTVVPPLISSSPKSVNVINSNSFSLTVTAVGTNLQYQWFLNGSLINGATNNNYSITSSTTSDAGTYYVIVSNSSGSATSASVLVNVLQPPSQPAITSVTPGDSSAIVAFTVPVNSADSSITQFTVTSSGGQIITGNSSPITVTGLTNGINYTFTVTATNTVGTSISSVPSYPTTPATVPSAPSLGAITVGNGSASIAFTKPTNNGGSPISNYIVVATPISGGSTITTSGLISPVQITGLSNGTTYTFSLVAVNNAGSSQVVTSNPVSLLTPSILNQPVSTEVVAGYPASFSVTTNTSNTTYQWFFNNVAINGANSSTYTINSTSSSSSGSYYVVLTNSVGSTNSNTVTLSIDQPYSFSTYAGLAAKGAYADGVLANARFNSPVGLTIDSSKNLYITDPGNNVIRKITNAGVVSTIGGVPNTYGLTVGPVTSALFWTPIGIATDGQNIFISDQGAIRKITYGGSVLNLAGSAAYNISVLASPNGIACDSSGNIYVADSVANRIRLVTANGVISTLVGGTNAASNSGSYLLAGFLDSTGLASLFRNPYGVAIDTAGNIYVTDSGNNAIRKVTQAGVVTTIAGGGPNGTNAYGSPGFIDAVGANARFNNPTGICIDKAGNIYVADTGNNAIRKIDTNSVVTTIAGTSSLNPGSLDGVGINASFYKPTGIAIDGDGIIYVADNLNNTIRRGVPLSQTVQPPVITIQPVAQVSSIGTIASLTAGITSTGTTTYQWYDNGIAIPNANTASLILPSTQLSDTGIYTLTATNAGGSVTTKPVTIAVTSTPLVSQTTQLVNVSCLQQLPTNGLLTTGFVLQGSKPAQVLIRVSGPALTAFGVPNAMKDPKLKLYDSNQNIIASNIGWGGDPAIISAANAVSAFPIQDTKSADSAVVVTLTAGEYTVQGASSSGSAGNLLIEVYQLPAQ